MFQIFSSFAGHNEIEIKAKPKNGSKPKEKTNPVNRNKTATVSRSEQSSIKFEKPAPEKRDMALTVRVEINLPAGGSRETYDNIFQSIKANLLNE